MGVLSALNLFVEPAIADAKCPCPTKPRYVERYAVLYIASAPAGAVVISTLDGTTFSDAAGTPTEVMFIKSKFPFGASPVGLLVYKDCYRPAFGRISINRWYRTKEEARIYPHQYRPALEKIQVCTPQESS